MERGQLSNMQRDTAWEGIGLAERAQLSALPDGSDPNNPTPEQLAFQKRLERERELDENFGRGDIAQEVGRVATGAGAARQTELRIEEERRKDRKEQTDRAILLSTLSNMEADLSARYGEHFADNLFADLREDGLIEDDEYQRIMGIEDVEERRRAIAAAIQEGIDEGRIQPDDLEGHEWAQDWLEAHRAAAAERDLEAERGLSGELAADEMSADARFEADRRGSGSDQESENEFSSASTDAEQNNAIDSAGASFLSGTSLG
ncbi:hypothetical protein [Hyphobacterium sp.]|uniref:hypothetical protein n=1 Tax=Hyphobacterium sp. TaxID=2004662 RepID=UPI003BAD5449